MFRAMPITFEDRSDDTPEVALSRKIREAGQLLTWAAIHVSDATPAVGLGGLALALAQGAAHTGASIDEVLAAVKHYYRRARKTTRKPSGSGSSTPDISEKN